MMLNKKVVKLFYLQGDLLFIDNGPYLSSLEHVVDYYRNIPDGLPCPLLHPIQPGPKPPIPEMPPSIFNGVSTNTYFKLKLTCNIVFIRAIFFYQRVLSKRRRRLVQEKEFQILL